MKLLDAATQGIGIYSIPEAARYARMHVNTLRHWFGQAGVDRETLYASEVKSEELKAISFLDFVEVLAVRALRVDYGVSLQRIREALREAKDRYNIQHLFARKEHKTVLIGKDLHILFKEDPKNPVQITGQLKGQKSFRECIEVYMRDLDFDDNGLARIYKAYRFENEDIVLNPRVHFGEPVLRSSGYTAHTLYRAALTEGSIERAAVLYQVSVEAIEAAYRYWSSELGLAA
jgi:uncharacterized protein (DUF433 family)